MKTLLLARHAKSSWSDPDLSDFDRPLNKRGLRDAPRMGHFLKRHGVKPDRLISSPAARAWRTAELVAVEIGYDPSAIDAENRLYGASVQDTLEIARSLSNRWSSVMLFGHNPTTTSFLNTVCDVDIENVPTCGVAEIRVDTKDWALFGSARAELVGLFTPKTLSST